jgi:hypothetical protein
MRVILIVGFVSLIACSLAVPVPAPTEPENKDNTNDKGKQVRVFRSINKGRIFIFYLQESGGRVKDLPGVR